MLQSTQRSSISKSDCVLNSCAMKQDDYQFCTPFPKIFEQNILCDSFIQTDNLLKPDFQQKYDKHEITPYPLQQISSYNLAKNKQQRFREKGKQNIPQNFQGFISNLMNFKKFKNQSISQISNNAQNQRLSDQKSSILVQEISQSLVKIQLSKSLIQKSKSVNQQNEQSQSSFLCQDQNIDIDLPETSKFHNNLKIVCSNQSSLHSSQTLDQHSLSSVLSYRYNQQIQFFLTQEDENNSKNNDSQEGIRLLSELKSQLHSIMNHNQDEDLNKQFGKNQKIKIYENQKEIDSFNELSVDSPFSNTQKNFKISKSSELNLSTCDQMTIKLEELKSNILALNEKINYSISRKQLVLQNSSGYSNANSETKYNTQAIVEKQPQIYFKFQKQNSLNPKNAQKFIYHDSQVVLQNISKQDTEFKQQLQKILNQSNQQIIGYNEAQYQQQYSDKSQNSSMFQSSNLIRSMSQERQNQQQQSSKLSKSLLEEDQLLFERMSSANKKRLINRSESESFQSQFKMSLPKLKFLQNSVEKQNQNDLFLKSSLAESNLSILSNQAAVLQEIHKRFNSKFCKILQES